jgi:cobalt-precorrin-5B (C1)-methyltransferase
VARASGIGHVAGATGSTSEEAVRKLYGLPLSALIDMGDFVGAMLKYLRHHPIARVTIAGGFGKMTKLAQGALDLHSERSRIDFDWLARFMPDHARAHTRMANSALEVEQLAASLGVDVAGPVARAALDTVRDALKGAPIEADVVIVSRSGEIMGRA